ncbi:hypothetical protein TIFTF001_029302 [Ficus carica]|uniref:Uncharacterized protein n=1 Tax=Ficus carica TaxID=3494 RepID=A0AA88DR99_FICCA|nr:hypothetical protein TIFTF001_029302 [Ficus carica]
MQQRDIMRSCYELEFHQYLASQGLANSSTAMPPVYTTISSGPTTFYHHHHQKLERGVMTMRGCNFIPEERKRALASGGKQRKIGSLGRKRDENQENIKKSPQHRRRRALRMPCPHQVVKASRPSQNGARARAVRSARLRALGVPLKLQACGPRSQACSRVLRHAALLSASSPSPHEVLKIFSGPLDQKGGCWINLIG